MGCMDALEAEKFLAHSKIMKLNWIIFVTGWMSFIAVGSGLFLFWIFTENERSAPSEWIVPFVCDFIIG